jgi:acyl-CoA synthetase (AMP-forming)/AMP-acid ligase II
MLPGDVLRRNAKIYSRKVGLIDGDKQFTYKEINERVNRFSNGLRALGLKKGDKIGVLANNCHQFVEAYFAVAKGGFVIVPINTRFTEEEAAYVVNHSEAVALVYQEDTEFTEVAQRMLANVPAVKKVIAIGNGSSKIYPYESLLLDSSPEEPDVALKKDDLMMIMYTSGSTGAPKGVLATQGNIMANTNTMTLELRIVNEDINLLVMPLYHNGGLWPTFTHFYRGALVILLPRFDVETVYQIVEKEKVTFLNLVPTTVQRFVTHPDLNKYNIESLRLIMYAGAPITLPQLKNAMHTLGHFRFYTALGSTEANGLMTSFPTTEHFLEGPLAAKLGSVGRDGINVEVRIADEQGNELPPGKTGEIIARGDNISPGYWKMPAETAESFKNGWLFSGDMGVRDEDGYIFIVDRKKDIIISGGENISPKEVEEVVYQHPAVNEAAIFGIPDDVWGESVRAVISVKPEYQGKVTEKDVVDFCRKQLASYKIPRSVIFLDELPKTSIGKIAKADLKNMYGKKTS